MTLAASAPVARRSTRWLLLGSLALNLFFIGAGIAMAIRGPAPAPTWERNVFARADRIAATLPPADAAILRELINTSRQTIDKAQTNYRAMQDEVRETLRREPFSIDELRAGMSRTRAARQEFDQMLQNAFADAAAKMSPQGRQALATWSRSRSSRSRP